MNLRVAVNGVAVLAAGALLVGCALQPAPSATASRSTAKPVIRVTGAGGCTPLVRMLAGEYPEADRVEFDFLGGLDNESAFMGAARNEFDIGTISRPPNEEEARLGLDYAPLSSDGLVFVVHPSVSVGSLTTRQVREIYTGKIRNWREVGGPDMPIVPLDRTEADAAKIGLRERVLGDSTTTSTTVELAYEDDMLQGVEQTPGAVGFASLGAIRNGHAWARVLQLDGVSPSVASIHDGEYPLTRTLGVVLSPQASPEAREFVKWAGGPEAARIMEKKGWAAMTAAAAK